MAVTPTTKEIISEVIHDVAEKIGASKAILFGSMARNTHDKRSDVDVVFIKDTTERFIERPDLAMKLLYEQIKGRDIDVLIYTPKEFLTMQEDGNSFIRQIVKDGVVLYGN